MTAYLSLGSNLGDRWKNLRSALECLITKGFTILNQSSVYETAPWGVKNQENYLNMVIEITGFMTCRSLWEACRDCEVSIGRSAEQQHMMPRTIDIDILFCDKLCINESDLIVPHPKIQDRLFVLVPLMEIAEDFVDPRSGLEIWQLYDRCRDDGEVIIFDQKI